MIKLEHEVLPSPDQMEFVIEGMRNPKNSWDRSDSEIVYGYNSETELNNQPYRHLLGEADEDLMMRLAKAGTEHRKYMRMMPVYIRVTAPLYWWKEFDTYKVGTVSNSCSTMHKITAKEFTAEDFSCENLNGPASLNLMHTIKALNAYRDMYNSSDDTDVKKEAWWQMIQLLPSSYNQTRNVMVNYEVLTDIYRQRKNHKLDEWRSFCKLIESLPYSELITEATL